MSLVLDVADAVVMELTNAPPGTFNKAFIPMRAVLPTLELAELSDVHVTIVPRSVELTNASRILGQHDVQIDIGIQCKLGKDLDGEIVSLMQLVEEIADYLRRRPLQQTSFAVWVRATNEPIYAADHLAEKRLFTSVLTVTYRVLR